MMDDRIRGEIADYRLDQSGILYSYSHSIKRTIGNLNRNAILVRSITGKCPVPLLIFLKKSPVPDKAARELSRKLLPELYSAMAMVAENSLSALILKMVFRFQKPPIPIRSFENEAEAREWLLSLQRD